MNAGIPKVASSVEALQRLEQSRAIWQVWRPGSFDFGTGLGLRQVIGKYSYVRARQLAKDRVEFTLFVVSPDDRVVLRALISTDPAQLKGEPMGKRDHWRSFESHWVERGADVGKHDGGAPPRTVDALYDDCAKLIREHPSAPARLFFHPDGVLMQCGFAPEDCSDCGEVSVQSYSHFAVDARILSDEPAKWVCSTAWGVYLPGSIVPELQHWLACAATARAPHPVHTDPNDLCTIDPAACPDLQPDGDSYWQFSGNGCWVAPEHAPGPLEVGKPDLQPDGASNSEPLSGAASNDFDESIRQRQTRSQYYA
ncbi:MAG TPA: hypothetical protein VER96_05240 [Polyangiaceae bacterium]|nr:hypothetical protein [Polyangiaceae bacterium]